MSNTLEYIQYFYGRKKTSLHMYDSSQKECWVNQGVKDASSCQESADHEGCALQV